MLFSLSFGIVSKLQGQCNSGGFEDDVTALQALYDATNGEGWTEKWNLLGVQTPSDLDDLLGVEIDNMGCRVRRLDLKGNNLDGELPTELGKLTRLEFLELAQNSLSGVIPNEIQEITLLKELNLEGNRDLTTYQFPGWIEQLNELNSIKLGQTNVAGEIPVWLGNLTKLSELHLDDNQLTGEIPAALGNATELRGLRLNNNQLSGELPAELGRLIKLEDLYLHYNLFSGAIPKTLGDMTEVAFVRLDHNRLSGEIPTEITNPGGMFELRLDNNMLSGEIRPELISRFNQIENVRIGHNRLTGVLPANVTIEHGSRILQGLWLNDNWLKGELPLWFSQLPGLRNLYFQGGEEHELCAPIDDEFQMWLRELDDVNGPNCLEGEVGLVVPRIVHVTEGGANSYEMRLASEPTADVTVTIAGHEGTDISLSRSSVTFTNSNWGVNQTVTVNAGEDMDTVNDRVILLHTASGSNYSGVSAELEVRIIEEGGVATVSIQDLVVPEDVRSAAVRVVLNRPVDKDVIVEYSTEDGTAVANEDYVYRSAQVSILTGADEELIRIPILDDVAIEQPEIFFVFIRNIINGEPGSRTSATITIEDNDFPRLSIADAIEEEGAAHITFTVALDVPSSLPITVQYTTVDGTAVAGEDYVRVAAQLAIPAGELKREIRVSLIDDNLSEVDETFTVILSNPTNAVIDDDKAVGTIENDDEFLLSVGDVVVAENEGVAIFSVNLDRWNTAQDISVAYVTMDGTATAGSDYEEQAGKVVIPAGELSRTIAIAILDDEEPENSETFTLVLTVAQNARIADATGLGTIIDEDAELLLRIDDVTVPESVENATFTVTLSGQSPNRVSVQFATSDETAMAGDDYVAMSGSLVFDPGEVQGSISIPVLMDEMDEPDEAFLVTLSDAIYAEIADNVGRGTITDDDEPLTVSIYDARVSENAGLVHLPLRLNRQSEVAVAAYFATSDVSAVASLDYRASQGIAVFEPGSTKGVVAIRIEDDVLNEEEETFLVSLSRAVNAEIGQGTGIGYIVDDEGVPALRIDDITASESEGEALFTVRLSVPTKHVVTVIYRTVDGTAIADFDYIASSGKIVFAPGELERVVRVRLLNDGRDWRMETFSLALASADHARLERAVAVATIVEEEDVEEGLLNAYLTRFSRTVAGHVVQAISDRVGWQGADPVCLPIAHQGLFNIRYVNPSWDPSPGQVLSGCGLALGMDTRAGGSLWGRGAYSYLTGREGALSLQSGVATGTAGADYEWRSGLLAGFLVSRSQGSGNFDVHVEEGEVGSILTGVYPYAAFGLGKDSQLWAVVGLGRGSVEVVSVERLDAKFNSRLAAIGANGRLAGGRRARLSYEADAFVARVQADGRSELFTNRLRIGLEGSLRFNRSVRSYLEAGLRGDGGDAETGLGVEVGGGLRYSPPRSRLQMEIRSRALVMHAVEDFTTWGVAGSVRYGNRGGLGPTAELRPIWGPVRYGGVQTMWRHDSVVNAARGTMGEKQIELEFSYGMPLTIGSGVVRPVLAVSVRERGKDYRLGYDVRMRNGLSLSVSGLAMESVMPFHPVSYGTSVHSTLRW